jgi:hypothetical protein
MAFCKFLFLRLRNISKAWFDYVASYVGGSIAIGRDPLVGKAAKSEVTNLPHCYSKYRKVTTKPLDLLCHWLAIYVADVFSYPKTLKLYNQLFH